MTQDTVIAARELQQSGQSSNTWYNNTIVYTHGFGVVAAYGNKRTLGRAAQFLESGIPSTGRLGEFEPRIYFGEDSPELLDRRRPEGTTPSSSTTRRARRTRAPAAEPTTTFSGNGGPLLDDFFKKLVYAIKFQSEKILLSDAVTTDSQILYDRRPEGARAEGRART